MKTLIILTILLISTGALAHKSHKDYARWFERVSNDKLVHTFVTCWDDSSGNGYYTCELIKNSSGTGIGYEDDYKFLTHHLRKLNKDVEDGYNIPQLMLNRSKNVKI